MCLSLVTLALAGCSKPVGEEPVRPVRAIKVGDVAAIQGRGYPGRAAPVEEVELSFRVSGPLVALPVKVGDRVKKDDLIAAIDPRDFHTALDLAQGNLERSKAELLAMERGARPEEIEQLKAALAEARATAKQAAAEHARSIELFQKNALSRSDFDLSLARRERTAAQVKVAQESLRIGVEGAREEDLQAKRAEIRALEAAVADAKNKLEYATLRAPFGGELAAKYVENFQTVQAKQPIVRLLDTSKIKVTVQVPESVIALVPEVKKAVCRFDALPGREFEGQVTEIGTEATRTTRTYPVTMQLDQPKDVKIVPGMAAVVRGKLDELLASAARKLAVPAEAIFTPETEKQNYVWVVDADAGTVSRRKVVTGELTTGGVSITDGLKPGEWIVTAGVHSLQEGQKVRILQTRGT